MKKHRAVRRRTPLSARNAPGDAGQSGPRILSLKQPWAWAVAAGKKNIENRSWSTPYRGTVYIHASSKLDRAGIEWLRDEAHVIPPPEFAHGAVVAVADIVDVVTKRDATKFAPWFFGPYGFVLTRIRRLRIPVPQKGRLGLARPPADLQRRVARSLRSSGSKARERE